VGGDCGIETAVVSYLNATYAGSLAVVWLDAHPDLNTPESSPSGHVHGMPLRILLGEGDAAFTAFVERPLRPDQLLLAGMRAPDPPERALVEARRIRGLSTESLLEDPGELLRWVRGTGLGQTYVHLDLDVCDPREVPTVACPTPGGLSVSALLEILDTLGRETSIVGAGLTEAMFESAAVPPALQPILDWFGRQ
jgi:arginase